MEKKYFQKGFNDSDVQTYHKYQIDMAVLLGANRNKAEKELKEALEFEMQLSNVRNNYFLREALYYRCILELGNKLLNVMCSFPCLTKRGGTSPNYSTT
jgi:hypothetical protein